MDYDSELITKSYTEALSSQCESIETQLVESGIDEKYSRLLSIQSVYNTLKILVGQLNDKDSQEKIFKAINYDAHNLVFNTDPNVAYVGNS